MEGVIKGHSKIPVLDRKERKMMPVIEIKTPRDVAGVSWGEHEFGPFIHSEKCMACLLYGGAEAAVTTGCNSQ